MRREPVSERARGAKRYAARAIAALLLLALSLTLYALLILGG